MKEKNETPPHWRRTKASPVQKVAALLIIVVGMLILMENTQCSNMPDSNGRESNGPRTMTEETEMVVQTASNPIRELIEQANRIIRNPDQDAGNEDVEIITRQARGLVTNVRQITEITLRAGQGDLKLSSDGYQATLEYKRADQNRWVPVAVSKEQSKRLAQFTTILGV